MDARLPRLETIRVRKAEIARIAFAEAQRQFAAAHRHHDMLVQRRLQAGRKAEAAAKADMTQLTTSTVAMSDISAVHEGDTRRRAALQALDREIEQAMLARERLRAIAIEKQQAYLAAKRSAEKLGLMVGKLRESEISLQILLSESRSDSVMKDVATGQWKLLQTDS